MPDPTMPPPVLADSKPGWPTGLGIIALIFGIGGALATLFGLVNYFVPAMATNAGLPEDFYVKYRPTMVPITLLTAAIAILLAVGGILLLKRRQKSAKLLKTWSILKIAVSVISIYFGMQIQKETMEVMTATVTGGEGGPGAESAAMVASTMSAMMPVIMILSLLWAWALPVFFLIWFSRAKVQNEVSEMA